MIDVSPVESILPVVLFLMVVILVFAVLQKIKLFESKLINVIISLLIAAVFISAVGAREYVKTATPWFAVLLVLLFFSMMFLGFIGKGVEDWGKGIGRLFLIVLLIGFIGLGIAMFSPELQPFLYRFSDSKVYSAIILVLVSIFVGWALVKAK